MKPKIQKIKSTVPQKVGKILLWTLVVFFILRGIGTIFKEDEKQTAQAIIDTYIKSTVNKSNIESQGKAFAESFALEYLTMNGRDRESYINRLQNYTGKGVDFNINLQSNVKTEAFSANSYKANWVSENSFTVDIRAKVKYFNNAAERDSVNSTELMNQTEPDSSYVIRDVNIRIPVCSQDNMFQISGYPAFLPATDKAEIEPKSYSGQEVSEDLKKTIKGVMESFFKIYFTGSPEEISYYMLDSTVKQKGLEGRFEFVKLDEISVYITDSVDRYYVITKVSVKDSINEVAIPQEYKINLVKKEDKYYISNMDI